MAPEKKQRRGILGTKLGMTQVFDENNRVVPVTVVKAGPNVVTRIRTPERLESDSGLCPVHRAGCQQPRTIGQIARDNRSRPAESSA